MLDLEAARRVVLRELDGTVGRLAAASAEDWRRPVRCAGWEVADIAVHLGAGLPMAAEALRRMVAGITDPAPAPAPIAADPETLLRALRAGRGLLADALARATPESLTQACPYPFATVPGFIGLQILAVEAGMHRNDLEWALGNDEPLAADVLDAAGTLVLPLLVRTSQRTTAAKPSSTLAYALSGPTITVNVAFRDGVWAAGTNGAACEIAGDDSAIALFAFGRIPATHPSLKVDGDPAVAARFKTYFPGP